PTFSVESKYAVGANKAKAGRWEGDKYIPAASWLGKKPSIDPLGLKHIPKSSIKKMGISTAKAVTSGALGMGELAVQGYEGVAAAILGQGFETGAEATEKYFKSLHEIASKATGVN